MLELFVENLIINVLTGVYSEETKRPQPLRISIKAELLHPDRYEPDSPLRLSKDYMDLKRAATNLPKGQHFTLLEAVAFHIADTIGSDDQRVTSVTVRIVKLGISEGDEDIGITLTRRREPIAPLSRHS